MREGETLALAKSGWPVAMETVAEKLLRSQSSRKDNRALFSCMAPFVCLQF